DGADIYLMLDAAHHSAAEISDTGTTGSDELRFASSTAAQTLTVFAADTGLEKVTIGTGSAAAPVSTATTALNINAAAAPNALAITGNAGANSLTGTAFADILIGGGGNDTLIGGGGADTFRFDTTPNSTTNRDILTNFNPAEGDRIELENAVFTALTTTGSLATGAFVVGSIFTTLDQRILYNPTTGALTYDSNGSDPTAATLATFATLPTGLSAQMSAAQFTVT
ncbi:MAG: M10 family metallopeptidase C-terminal domain-containing protein, partial [Cyanobacteriota bacterium]